MIDHKPLSTEWKSLQQKKTRKNKLDVGKLYVRYKPRKHGRHTMMVYIGNEIMERMGWQTGTRMDILRHESRHTQFIIMPDLQGTVISRGDKAHAGLVKLVRIKAIRLMMTNLFRFTSWNTET